MKIQFEKEEKPNLEINKLILAKLVESWGSRYTILYVSDSPKHSIFKYKFYADEFGEEVPISAIEAWAEIE